MHYVQTDEGKDLRMLAGLVSQHGTEKLESAVDRVIEGEENADRIVSTAHKAKGREWDDVHVLPGFATGLTSGVTAREDIRLFYVAITRASLRLVVDEKELAAFQNGPESVVVQCVNGHRMRVSTSLRGRVGKCSRCGVDVRIPDVGDELDKITFFCPNGHRIRVSRKLAGKEGRCSHCQVTVAVPCR